MIYKIVEETSTCLAEYGEIPIRFKVQSVFDVEGDDPATAELVERPVERPRIKDYDLIKGEGPTRWDKWWDVSNWGIMAAYVAGRRVGGTVLAYKTDGVNKLEGRDDVVVMWDLRVHPEFRRNGVGRSLFEAGVEWARERHCCELRVETQNINVAACRFYQRMGCRLHSIRRGAYETLPDEVELIWTFSIDGM